MIFNLLEQEQNFLTIFCSVTLQNHCMHGRRLVKNIEEAKKILGAITDEIMGAYQILGGTCPGCP